jgi:hypothetical protein
MKTGPHRKMQLLTSQVQTIDLVQEPIKVGKPFKTQLNLHQLGLDQQTPTGGGLASSERSGGKAAKNTPTKASIARDSKSPRTTT